MECVKIINQVINFNNILSGINGGKAAYLAEAADKDKHNLKKDYSIYNVINSPV